MGGGGEYVRGFKSKIYRYHMMISKSSDNAGIVITGDGA